MIEASRNSLCCRFCGGKLFHEPLLAIHHSPASAQGFLASPDESSGTVDLKIYQCQFCALVQHVLPAVSYYKDTIRAVAFSQEMHAFRRKQLSHWLQDTDLKDRRILEVGSGKGEYLELLRLSGAHRVTGLEHDLMSVEFARAKGLDIFQGYLNESFVSPWGEPFEGFAIFSFLEHWPDLSSSLRVLHGLLVEGASGLIEVPNFQFMLQKNLYSEFTPDHIFYFEPSTLRTVLEITGFVVESMESIWHDYILSVRVKKQSKIDGAGFSRQQALVVAEIDDFVGRFQSHEVVVWGAGHQALAVMSMAGLGDRISHVIDSASFKQGKFTPGTGLLIKAPQTLNQDSPKAIIIMAAGYSDEVLSIVRREHPQVRNIAILREYGLEIVSREG